MSSMQTPALPASVPAAIPEAPGATVTIFTNGNGRPLSKVATLDSEGRLVVTPSAQLSKGTFRAPLARNVSALRDTISGLTTSEAITHGLPKSGAQSGTVVSEAKLPDNPGAITRSLKDFRWGSGPGWLMLDLDLKDFPVGNYPGLDLSSLESIRSRLCDAVPELHDVPMLGLPSASAMLYRTADGEQLRGLTGARFYIPVEHAADIPEFGRRLFDLLVFVGLGYPFISKSGRVFVRTLIDASVWSPERLDFIGGAACGVGVEQRRGAPQIWNADNAAWFSPGALSAEENEELAGITRDLKAIASEEAAAVRAKYAEARAAAGHPIAATEGEDGLISLAPQHAIELADGTWITVADILAHPEQHHGRHCSDPMEPEYAPRTTHIAKIFTDGQRSGLAINSLAHGGIKYVLDRGGPVPAAEDDFSLPEPAPPLYVTSLGELMKDPALLAPPVAVIPRLAWRGRVTLLAAREKLGKSTFVTAGAAAVTTGGEFLGAPTERGTVLWFGTDEALGDTASRLAAFGADPDKVFLLYLRPSPKEFLPVLRSTVERLRPTLVVLDSLATSMSGIVSEFSKPEQYTVAMAELAQIARNFNPALVLIHHGKKDDSGYRDSTAIGAGVDMILTLTGDESSKRVLRALGRFALAHYAVRLDGTRYSLVGVGAETLEVKVLNYLRQNPGGVTTNAVSLGVGGRKTEVLETLERLKRAALVMDPRHGGSPNAGHKWELEPTEPGNLDDLVGRNLHDAG